MPNGNVPDSLVDSDLLRELQPLTGIDATTQPDTRTTPVSQKNWHDTAEYRNVQALKTP
jgi:hypothetical protein